MRERPNRTVSKTVVAQVTVGSNPTPSAARVLDNIENPLDENPCRLPSANRRAFFAPPCRASRLLTGELALAGHRVPPEKRVTEAAREAGITLGW